MSQQEIAELKERLSAVLMELDSAVRARFPRPHGKQTVVERDQDPDDFRGEQPVVDPTLPPVPKEGQKPPVAVGESDRVGREPVAGPTMIKVDTSSAASKSWLWAAMSRLRNLWLTIRDSIKQLFARTR